MFILISSIGSHVINKTEMTADRTFYPEEHHMIFTWTKNIIVLLSLLFLVNSTDSSWIQIMNLWLNDGDHQVKISNIRRSGKVNTESDQWKAVGQRQYFGDNSSEKAKRTLRNHDSSAPESRNEMTFPSHSFIFYSVVSFFVSFNSSLNKQSSRI